MAYARDAEQRQECRRDDDRKSASTQTTDRALTAGLGGAAIGGAIGGPIGAVVGTAFGVGLVLTTTHHGRSSRATR